VWPLPFWPSRDSQTGDWVSPPAKRPRHDRPGPKYTERILREPSGDRSHRLNGDAEHFSSGTNHAFDLDQVGGAFRRDDRLWQHPLSLSHRRVP